ncbi:serine-threonine protein kinase [Penicillium chrysogenum]|nr:serine-threonine protein kinase [Penicillium chrysogenum]
MADRAQEPFGHVSIGQALNNRYQIIKSLGWGRYSTVWLAKDQVDLSYKAIKVLREDCYGGECNIFELEILKCLSEGDITHPGYRHVSRLLDNFVHDRCVCLVLEPMAEHMKDFCFFFRDAKIPNDILKRITKQLLSALDYAHSMGIIHADIKQDNIMVRIRDYNIIDRHLQDPHHSLGEYNFDKPSDLPEVEVVLGDWGAASWESHHLSAMIQPTLLRAPEVLLQASWGKEVDIWNLGALLPELLDTVRMFSGRSDASGGEYLIKHHVEEIDALFGPFPPSLLKEGKPEIVRQIFDEDFRIKDPTTRPPARLETWIECLEGVEKKRFLSLLRSMMEIDPRQRMSPLSLQNEPWLSN